MEPIEADPGEPAHGRARGRRIRALVAALAAVGVVTAVVGVVAATRPDRTVAPLVLRPGDRVGEPAASGPLVPGSPTYRFRLGGAAPDLGTNAPVARLEAPKVDAGVVASLAGALGLSGPPTTGAGGSWQVLDAPASLILDPTPGGWALSYSASAGGSSPGSVGGSPPGTAGGSSGSASVPAPAPGLPPTGATTTPGSAPGSAPTTSARPPASLPDAAGAERIARALLDRMGIHGDWAATVDTLSSGAVACAPQPCATPMYEVVTSRSVTLRPRFAGVAIDGLSWHVDVGDHGRILDVSGTWTDLRTLDRFPLRPVAAVFADLVAGRGIDLDPVPVAMGAAETTVAGGAAAPNQARAETVTIDRITLGFAVVPANADGAAVVDVVPTYVFSGRTAAGTEVTRTLVAVAAEIAPPTTTSTPAATRPTPSGPAPIPMPAPAPAPTMSGTPPT